MTDDRSREGFDRRAFLKTAAVSGAGAAGALAAGIAPPRVAAAANSPGDAAGGAGEAGGAEPARGTGAAAGSSLGDRVIPRPGSDFMVDVLKTLGLDYVACNPGSSFRSLHESVVNYGGNSKPELLTCMHEESSVAIAHGYAKAAGKPMAVLAHGTVGLQHASMAIYNAWCDRVPIVVVAGTALDAAKRRPGTEWYHSVQDAASLVRDFVKWDDQPASLQHFAESMVRAYRVATTAPMEPTLIVADMELQENPVEGEAALTIPKMIASTPPQGDRAALEEAARMLVEARAPVIVAERAVRSQEGVDRLVALAEALGAPVVDLGARMNFPNRHPLCHTDRRAALMREADVVLLLEVADRWGQLHSVGDPHKDLRESAKPDIKTISVSMADLYLRSNYQDFQRFQSIDLAISGDVQASLPMLTELVQRASSAERKRLATERSAALGQQRRRELDRAREEAAVAWNESPVTTARLAMELWDVIKHEPWSLAVSDRIPWARRLWPTTRYEQMLGGSGGQGVGYAAPGAVGVALANKAKGLLTVTFQPDGDLLYAPGALWTAAHHKIPLLFVMHNNRGYHQEVMHLQRMAALHDRRPDQAWIGTTIEQPNVDFAKLAQGFGVWAEGPVTDPNALGPVLRRALAVVRSGAPALVDVVCQPR